MHNERHHSARHLSETVLMRLIVPGVHEIFALEPNKAVLRLRSLVGEVIVEIENGTTKTSSAASLTPAEARRLASDLPNDRGGSERITYGRDADGVHFVGAMLVIRFDGKNKDRVVIEGTKKIQRLSALLGMLADQAEPEPL